MTIGAYFGMKECKVDGSTVNLAIWDTAGEEKFDSLTNFYCRGARAAVICYDLTNKATFDGLSRWVTKVTTQAHENCAIILVGNKLDIVESDPSLRKVGSAEAASFAQEIGADFIEASAQKPTNVTPAFEKVVRSSFIKGGEIRDPNETGVDITDGGGSSGCC